MKKTITLVEINVYDDMLPLVSGYLEAYACTDPALRSAYSFHKYSTNRNVSLADMQQEITRHDSDIYAFSCYIWNMGRVKALVRQLLATRPEAWILLGGPQVMGHIGDYVYPSRERVVVCNGEGEATFAAFLRELTNPRPDLTRVPGVSFFRERQLLTTDAAPRIRVLDDIPSPFLSGLYERQYRVSVIETNRGCPFHCGFCFWGAATNDKVFRFSDERVREDIEWLSKHGVPFLVIADANWGMQERDIRFSRHIVDCKSRYAAPVYVYFSAAKNSPQRVAEVTQIFKSAGLFSAQPISMQSLDATTLERVQRKNIKLSAYEDLQTDLNRRDISSFIELIWPLPGETLDSFKQGIETLCTKGAKYLLVYPHLLLHNTPVYDQRENHGLVVRAIEDEAAEAEIVVETADVSRAEFEAGMWFFYAVLTLHNTNTLRAVADYLHSTGIVSYAQLCTAFADFCKTRSSHPFSEYCQKSIEEADYYDVYNYPMVYFLILHEHRRDFDRLLYDFARTQPWWHDETARFLFELDALSRPYIYCNTPFERPPMDFSTIKVRESSSRRHLVEIPAAHAGTFAQYAALEGSGANPGRVVSLAHNLAYFPYRPNQSKQTYADYCSGAVMRIASVTPNWSLATG